MGEETKQAAQPQRSDQCELCLKRVDHDKCEYPDEGAASSEPQEWTPDTVLKILDYYVCTIPRSNCKAVADAHTAALADIVSAAQMAKTLNGAHIKQLKRQLAAEREESERVAQTLYRNIKEAQQELASEQQRWADQSNRLYKMIQDRDKELAAEREQREKESRHLRNYINDLQWKLADEREKSDRLDGALHHPDDENHTCLFKSRLLAVQAANKPLVEALEWYVMNSLTPQRAKAALATAKDGKHTEWWRLPDSEGRPRDRK